MDNPVAANILGTAGAVCWSVQLIPQIITNHRRHHADGVQPTMMLLWALAGLPLGVYNIAQGFNVALQVQPQLLTFLSLVTWAQCKYYGPAAGSQKRDEEEEQEVEAATDSATAAGSAHVHGHSRGNVDDDRAADDVVTSPNVVRPHSPIPSTTTANIPPRTPVTSHSQSTPETTSPESHRRWPLCPHILLVTSAIALALGGIQAGLVFALRHYTTTTTTSNTTTTTTTKAPLTAWPYTLMAILSALLLSAGVLRHYWDIYTTRTVRGISFLFVAIDALGDLTSLLSLFFEVRRGTRDAEAQGQGTSEGVDVLGIVIYGSELVLWIGVMACGVVFNLRPWLLRRKRRGRRRRGEGNADKS
ncbi:PQ loop repeat-domain-containing protein [Microdochium trichocladiopsis]|uniref:PQ loop repeat-domain-containing protein n=1 Tax=Microdochium trichocladiopsis TaxID=1682393 RepID=A0A9P8XVH0_9PEZI|nr:PQ loop repeat-domain-containing protein [Microdochium trichocladiopsis]KAH7020915.1 PQ loop repeat-domain-containing protein [Microdochium trichocladiopsis]